MAIFVSVLYIWVAPDEDSPDVQRLHDGHGQTSSRRACPFNLEGVVSILLPRRPLGTKPSIPPVAAASFRHRARTQETVIRITFEKYSVYFE